MRSDLPDIKEFFSERLGAPRLGREGRLPTSLAASAGRRVAAPAGLEREVAATVELGAGDAGLAPSLAGFAAAATCFPCLLSVRASSA